MNKDRQKLIVSASALAVLLLVCIGLQTSLSKAEKSLALMESIYADMSGNKPLLKSMASETSILKSRAEENRNKNFVSEMEKTAAAAGLSKMLKKINFVSHSEEGKFKGDVYELKLEGVDMNSAVNFMYRISVSGVVAKVKQCSMAVSFENPSLLNVSLVVSHAA